MSTLQEIISYTLPKLQKGKEWVIYFYAFDPALGKLHRKRIKLNHIISIKERRQYAKDLMKRISEKLALGWNPQIESENQNSYVFFKDVIDIYRNYLTKLFRDGVYRQETYTCYISYCMNFENFNNSLTNPLPSIYQFNR